MDDFARYLAATRLAPQEIANKAAAIHRNLLQSSRYVRTENFQAIHPHDLAYLFDAYDASFFGGQIRRRLGQIPLSFRLSRRMTSAGGKTTRRSTSKQPSAPVLDYEISISTTLLFQTFQDENRLVTVTGLPCTNRLQALQRIFEHEMMHLIEMLVWRDSNCAAKRFQAITANFFGHRQHTHQLITQRERAWTKFGLKVGDRVAFRFDGRHYEGFLNRLTRRATVLVEDPQGVRYSDGKLYAKFYVPVEQLRATQAASSRGEK